MENKKNILILGSDGYLGSHLVAKLNSDEFNIMKFDLSPVNKDTLKLDTKNIDDVLKIFENHQFDVVISLVGLLPGRLTKKKLYDANLSAVEYLKNINISAHFIFTSSTAVYSNESHQKSPTVKPFEIYGASKLDSENVIKNFVNSYSILRIGTMISKNRDGGIMNFLKRIKKGQIIWMPFKGKVVHPFVSVDDVVNVIIYLCKNSITGTFDIIADERMSLSNLAFKLNPKYKKISFSILDKFITYFGSDRFPVFGISKWHLNALKYNLPISEPEYTWEYTNLDNMSEVVINTIND